MIGAFWVGAAIPPEATAAAAFAAPVAFTAGATDELTSASSEESVSPSAMSWKGPLAPPSRSSTEAPA